MSPLLVSRPEAARLLGVSESSVQRLVRSKHLTPVYVGGNTRFRITDLNHYVDGLPAATTTDTGKDDQ